MNPPKPLSKLCHLGLLSLLMSSGLILSAPATAQNLEETTSSQSNPSAEPPSSAQNKTLSTPGPERQLSPERTGQTSVNVTPTQTVQTSVAEPKEISVPRILGPVDDTLINNPAVPVVVQSKIEDEIELRINGRLVDKSLIGRTEKDSQTGLMKQTWYGVVFRDGPNELAVFNKGASEPSHSIVVRVPGRPTAIQLGSVESRIPADGYSVATIEGYLVDDEGLPSVWDAEITLSATAGEFIGIDSKPDVPGFQVKSERGKFTAQLKSGVEAGIVRVRAKSPQFEGYHQLKFETDLRQEPLFTGVVDLRFGRRGTNFFDDFEDFLPQDEKYGFQVDAKAKAFGNASIGEWSITGAIDSERALNTNCEGRSTLFRAKGVDCEREYYPSYGDNSTSTFIAPSKDNVYLRLERSPNHENTNPDYFLWGDYNTQEFSQPSQEFSAIGRSFNGFKGHYNLGRLQITGLYGKDADGFQRDTIAPDGTRGLYFLSRRELISGSENIFLELEELNRPGTVVERISLVPGADYEIDYDRGTVFFRRPVMRTDISDDGVLLTRKIIATYQFEGEVNQTDVFAGRVQYDFNRNPESATWAGATYFLEDRGSQTFELYGADAQISLGKTGKLIAEYAHSTNGLDFDKPVSGDAFRAELEGSLFKDRVTGRAYWRTTDEGFSNNATTSFVPGQTRYGGNVEAEITSTTALRFSYDHEDNFGVAPEKLDSLSDLINPGFAPQPGAPLDNSLTTIKAGVIQDIGKAELKVDWVHRDRTDDIAGTDRTTNQISTALNVPITRKLDFHAYSDVTLSNETDPNYPTRLTAGLDWEVHPNISLGLNQTYLDGGQYDNDFLTTLDIDAHHTFKTGTILRGQTSIVGDRGLAGRFGVEQGLTLAPGLKLDVSYEHLFKMPFKTTAAGEQFAQPFAVGTGGSALGVTPGHSFSTGLSYNNNSDFQVNSRFDYNISSDRSNMAFSTNALGKISPSLTGVGNFRWTNVANQTLDNLGDNIDLKLGLAYRNPKNDKFNGLLRYEYRQNPSTIPETLLLGQGTGSREHLLAVEGVYAPNWRWELYGKAGVRHSRTNLAEDLIGSSTIGIGQLRLTHRFDYRWDVAGEIRYVGQGNSNYREIGGAVEVGHYVNPNLRLGVGYAFGDINDPDVGASRSSSGPYLGFTLKLDNNLLKDFGFGNTKRRPKKKNQAEPEKPVIQAEKMQEKQAKQPKPDASEPKDLEVKSVDSAITEAPSSSVPLTSSDLKKN